jgi:hypothetical protein
VSDHADREAPATLLDSETTGVASELPATEEIIEKLLQAVNDASGKAQGYWVSFLGITGFLAVTVAGTTHRQSS